MEAICVKYVVVQMGVGLAGAGVRTAASIATTPFRVPFRAAQRRYFPIGRQLFLYSDTVSTVIPGRFPSSSEILLHGQLGRTIGWKWVPDLPLTAP